MPTPTAFPVRFWSSALAGLLVVSAASPACAAGDLPALSEAAGTNSSAVPGLAGSEAAQAGWWSVYRDPALDALIARLHAANQTIAQARARLAMARADARMGQAAGLPALDLSGSAAHAGGPLVNAAGQSGDLFTARATASWQLDLLGQLSAERRAGRHEVGAAQAALADVTLLMETAVVRAWIARKTAALAADDAARASAVLEDLAALSVDRARLGLVAKVDLDRPRDRVRAAAARVRDLAFARDRADRQLAYLVDAAPGSLALPAQATLPVQTALPAQAALPVAPAIPDGLPADLLERRPDLRAARARVLAADARLSAIRKGWLPPIALTASQGQASPSLGQLIASSAGFFGLGALLAIPVFDGGRQRARVEHGRAEKALQEAAYRERAGAALRDVYDNLQIAQNTRARAAEAAAAAAVATDRLTLARARAANGTVGREQVLEAEAAALDRRVAATLATGEHLTSVSELQAALGGGW